MGKTKFEVLMNVEVADVDGTPVSGEDIGNLISKAIENIYFNEPVDIKSIHVSRTGRVIVCGNCEQETSKLIKGLCIDCDKNKNTWQEEEVCDECDKPSKTFIQCDDNKCCPSCAAEWEEAEQKNNKRIKTKHFI